MILIEMNGYLERCKRLSEALEKQKAEVDKAIAIMQEALKQNREGN